MWASRRLACLAFPTGRQAGCAWRPTLTDWDRFDVRAALHGALGVDTVLENDVNAALLGEHWAGENRGIDNLVYVNVGTGLGAGILCNGALIRGFKGAAGQISAVPIGADPEDPESPPGRCA